MLIGIIIIIILFIIGLITILNMTKRIMDRKNKLAVILKARFENYISKYSISKLEINLIERMSRFLKNPLKKYLFFINPHTFNICFQLLSKSEKVDKNIRISFYEKLGIIHFDPNEVPNSSKDFAEGTPVKLMSKDKKTIINGCITRQLTDAIVLKSLDSFINLSNKDEILLVTHNHTGLYSFKTRIIKVENKAIYAAHSGDIIRTQDRKNFRKIINLPILIRLADSNKTPDHAYINDLSTGGISVTNPGKKYLKNDDVFLFFNNKEEKRFHLYGEVVRVSWNNNILHIKFNHITTRDRNHLFSFIQTKLPL